MTGFKRIVGGTIVATALSSAVPSAAVISTFATFSTIGTGANIRWQNNGAGAVASNGTGGSIYTIATASSNTPGAVNVKFSFLQAAIAPFVTDVAAKFTLNASVINSPAQLLSGFYIEPGISGSFSFISTSAITVGATTYAAGSNLLSAMFDQGTIFGKAAGTSGSFSSATSSGATITYTSDFLNFSSTVDRDFSLNLTSITSPLARASSTKALRTFKASAGGSFSSDPAPLINAVPEPQVWGMMIIGFGLIGITSRRRNSVAAA